MYGTTKQFLEYFGLKSLDTLPNLEELEVLDQRMNEADDGSDEGIPESALAVNSLERQKQRAIAEAERGTVGESAQVEPAADQQESENLEFEQAEGGHAEDNFESSIDSQNLGESDQEQTEDSAQSQNQNGISNDGVNTETEQHEDVASIEETTTSEPAMTEGQNTQSETQGGTATLEALETTAEDKDTDEPKQL